MAFLIVSGMSGAGKSKAINVLEDLGYYCVDNMPPNFLLEFVEMQRADGETFGNAAVVIDARSKAMFHAFLGALEQLKKQDIPYTLLFLDAQEDVLLNRYKETRRLHPMLSAVHASLPEAIARERALLAPIWDQADHIIDTSHILLRQLKERIVGMLLGVDAKQSLFIQCLSFGYKHGLPAESDLVFDVRCLPNPFYDEELKPQTGLDQPVREYVMRWPQTQTLLGKIRDLLSFLLPLYMEEGKSQLTISIGCTGGKHRSVVTAEHLGEYLRTLEYPVAVTHRDIAK